MAFRDLFLQVMKTYLQAKREKFSKEQPVFQLVTKAIPQAIEKLPFIPKDHYIIKGSVGQGVWTDVCCSSVILSYCNASVKMSV